jgi:formiminotetrahydrofolate cyclodeaminase
MRLSKAQYRRLFKVISDILEERSKVDYAASQREEKIAFLVGRLELLNDEIRNLESDEKEAFRKVVAVYNFPVQLTETIEEGD